MAILRVPNRLSERLSSDQRLHGAVLATLGSFERWVGQNAMPFFPDFTDHGTTHIARVMRGAESLIQERSWEHITPQDAGCLVLAVVLHDCAMHLSKDGFLRLLDRKHPWRPRGGFLDKFRDRPWPDLWDEFLREAMRWNARRLVAIFDRETTIHPPALALEAPWEEDHYRLVGEFLRRHHGRLAHEIAVAGVPGAVDASVQLAPMPGEWLTGLAGLISRSHAVSLRRALDSLERHGRKIWRKVHVPYLMAVLRIADYLELDSERAPQEVLKIRSLRSPISRLEWRKHHAVADIRPDEHDPEALFVDAEPPTVVTFLALRDLLTDLQREIDESWNVLGEVYGSDPRLRDLGLVVRRIHSTLDEVDHLAERVNYVPVDARFRASGGELLKLLIGPLYGDDPKYGVRELMQNAIDACRELEDWRERHPDVKVDVADQRAEIVVFIEEHGDRSATFTIQDRGIGMTAQTIVEFFLTAGASFRYSDAWLQRHVDLDGRPRIFRSGRFGVGVLAGFLIGTEIEVETRFVGSPTGLRFVCRLDSAHIELVKCECPVGTRIRINIQAPRDRDADRLGWVLASNELLSPRGEPAGTWRWYSAEKPSMARGVRLAFPRDVGARRIPADDVVWLEDAPEVPLPNGQLGRWWNRVEHNDYDAVHWFGKSTGGVWCNGLRVVQPSALLQPGLTWDAPGYQIALPRPAISVWDRAGRLPLSLRRDAVVVPDFLDDVLREPVCRDFIAYLLVRLDVDRSRCFGQLMRGTSKPDLFSGSSPVASIGHFRVFNAVWSDAHAIGIRQHEAFLVHPRTIRRAGVTSMLFLAAPRPTKVRQVDALLEQFFDHLIVVQPHLGTQFGNRDIRSGEELWECAALGEQLPARTLRQAFFMFAGLVGRTAAGREVLVLEPEYGGRDAHTPSPWDASELIGSYRYVGTGKLEQSNAREYARSVKGELASGFSKLAVWELEPPQDAEEPPDTLTELWLHLIGPRGIPLEAARRRDELCHAYMELDREISRWEKG